MLWGVWSALDCTLYIITKVNYDLLFSSKPGRAAKMAEEEFYMSV